MSTQRYVVALSILAAAAGAAHAETVAELGDSDAVQVGDEVLVVGAPLGMSRKLVDPRSVRSGAGP